MVKPVWYNISKVPVIKALHVKTGQS